MKRSDHEIVHNITIPMHRELARGTLNDILKKVASNCGWKKHELMERLKRK